jgi:uncharacterized membrane protein
MTPPPVEFQSLNDLTRYLGNLEDRIAMLEQENEELHELVSKTNIENKAVVDYVREVVPHTSLLSKNFISRAFTVWGHYFAAQLVISLVVFALYFIFVVLILGVNLFGG